MNVGIKSHEEWETPECQGTSSSKQNKEAKAFMFYKMETEEISERYIAPFFVNGVEAYDREINLEQDKNLISNKFAVKLCLEQEVKNGDKVIKKELIVALRGEIYFMKFIINPEEDDIKPGVILGRSFMRLTKGSSWTNRQPLTQEEASCEEIAIDIYKRFSILEEARPIIETMAYKEEAIKKVMGEALKEKEDSGAFVIPIHLEAKINLNALADTSSEINVMPFRIYAKFGRDEVKPVNREITMLNHSKADPMGLLKDVLCQVGVTTIIAKFLILDMPVDK
ncbi:transposase, Ptta/En/Spm, transposase, Tnp1/En/Spm-like protein [Tanacetum coccineum]